MSVIIVRSDMHNIRSLSYLMNSEQMDRSRAKPYESTKLSLCPKEFYGRARLLSVAQHTSLCYISQRALNLAVPSQMPQEGCFCH